MRWLFFILISLSAVIFQNTVCQLLWFRTPVGWVGPDVLAAVAVFFALFSRTATDAAINGWVLGFLLDLTITQPAPPMGLLPLIYAGASIGIFHIRGAFFKERVLTQMVMSFLFCLIVYGLWMSWDLAIGRTGSLFDDAVQLLGFSIYTAIITPLVCKILVRFESRLFPVRSLFKKR